MTKATASFPTLFDYACDGQTALEKIIAGSPYKNMLQAVASLTLFSHPDTVKQTGCRAAFPVIRNFAQRGKIGESGSTRVGFDDNRSPTCVFMWCNEIENRKRNVQFNHIYAYSDDPECYTCLANICVTPSFLAKLSDTNPEVQALLKFRVWTLYGWHPHRDKEPSEPDGYGDLVWAPFVSPVRDVRAAFLAAAKRRPKDRTTIFQSEFGLFEQIRDKTISSSQQIKTLSSGKQEIRDPTNRFLGTYDQKQNEARDPANSPVAKGDVLTSLIKPF